MKVGDKIHLIGEIVASEKDEQMTLYGDNGEPLFKVAQYLVVDISNEKSKGLATIMLEHPYDTMIPTETPNQESI